MNEIKTLVPSKYEFYAKVFPTYICCLPLLISIMTFSNSLLFLTELNKIGMLFCNVTIYLIISYTLIFFIRTLGKIVEQFFFDNEKDFPTTLFLLHDNEEFSKNYKQKIRDKISEHFNITLFDELQENNDKKEAKRIIKDAVGLIRNKVGDGKLLLNHNIQYGFVRNLIGGSIFGLTISLVNIFFVTPSTVYQNANIFLVCFFLLLILLHYPILRLFSKLYAIRLYSEFFSS